MAIGIEKKTCFENMTEVETPAGLSSCLSIDWEMMEKRVLGTLSVLVGISFVSTILWGVSSPTFSPCVSYVYKWLFLGSFLEFSALFPFPYPFFPVKTPCSIDFLRCFFLFKSQHFLLMGCHGTFLVYLF